MSSDGPMRCFTMAHIAQWWGITRSAVTMMRKRWGPDSAAPFPTPDVEIPTLSGTPGVLGWSWTRWPNEFENWDHRRKAATGSRGAARRAGPRQPSRRQTPSPRRTASADSLASQPAAEAADLPDDNSDDNSDSIRVRDYIKPARRTRHGVRHGRVATSRVARAVANGRFRR